MRACTVTILLLLTSCATGSPEPAPRGARWLSGDLDARFAAVARHLRGFDVTMAETGYRYVELYWAGKDENWEYAAYQLRKIGWVVQLGTERRPKRAKSAEMLDAALLEVKASIEHESPSEFDEAFGTLTTTCNACHQAERVGAYRVAPPEHRISPIRKGDVP